MYKRQVLAFVEGRRPFIALHLICLAVAVQIHPAAIGLAPATLLFLILYRRQIDWRYVALSAAVALLTAAPFLIYLWQRTPTTGGLPFSGGRTAGGLALDSFRLTFELAGGVGLRPLAGAEYAGLPGETIARVLWLALIVAATIWAIAHLARRPDQRMGRTLTIYLAWFLGPALLFLWQWTPVYIHYFIVALPAPYLLAGLFMWRFVGRASRAVRLSAGLALVLVAAWQLASWVGIMAAVARDPLAGGFSIPLGTKLAAADSARRLVAAGDAAEVLLVGGGSDPQQDDFPAEFRALLHGLPLRYIDINSEALFPGTTVAVLLDTPAADSLTSTRDLYEQTLTDSQPVPSLSFYVVGKLPAASAPPPDVALPEPALLANFVHLTGHNTPREIASGILWDVFWRPADNPDPADFHIFNHLINGQQNRVAQADAAAFAGAQWRPGDVVISRFHLPLATQPQPPLLMRVGMYRFPSLENVPVLDEAANPAADAVEFPLTP